MRRMAKNTIIVPYVDDLGEFPVEVRMLNPKELEAVNQMYARLIGYQAKVTVAAKSKNTSKEELVKEGEAIMDELYGWVEKVCVDKTLTKEYWKAGVGFTIDVPLNLLRVSMRESQRTTSDIRSFRKNEPRERPVSVSRSNQKDT